MFHKSRKYEPWCKTNPRSTICRRKRERDYETLNPGKSMRNLALNLIWAGIRNVSEGSWFLIPDIPLPLSASQMWTLLWRHSRNSVEPAQRETRNYLLLHSVSGKEWPNVYVQYHYFGIQTIKIMVGNLSAWFICFMWLLSIHWSNSTHVEGWSDTTKKKATSTLNKNKSNRYCDNI